MTYHIIGLSAWNHDDPLANEMQVYLDYKDGHTISCTDITGQPDTEMIPAPNLFVWEGEWDDDAAGLLEADANYTILVMEEIAPAVRQGFVAQANGKPEAKPTREKKPKDLPDVAEVNQARAALRAAGLSSAKANELVSATKPREQIVKDLVIECRGFKKAK